MARWLFLMLILCASLQAAACPLCLGAGQQTKAEQLISARQAVLAVPTIDGGRYRVIEVIKGERPPSGTVEGAYPRNAPIPDATAPASGKPLLLLRDDLFPTWVVLGAIGAEHAGWLRKLAAAKRSTAMNADEWRARVALMLPSLESSDALVAEIAYDEFAAAPYTALLTVKSRLAAPAVRRWLANPNLAARQRLYLLLLGIAGNAQDAARVERQLESAWESADATNVGSLIAADLQLRGPARMAWVDARYLTDPKRSTPEIEAALLALSVHGNANAAIPRERVIESYRLFMAAHKDIAGYVAQDFAAWQYWDAVPDYVALMKSKVRQQYPSQIAIIAYLRLSPDGQAGKIDLPKSGSLSQEQSTSADRKASAIPVSAY